ncbi:glycosyltransferase family 2 protein [Aminobacter aganoensis]|uniref:Cellulose synthase/poly-beta-1,6-N-acetylglucosamine synthase-like glycosyltransferase n=1 Tax=Aminobacter aganoensis TaxID=83264 RepID=A0A7X0F792_9HYPH|nr:glycosyltransferase family 2 protein [Aminobacter aganoensis]MBB6354364.1 cellulose synthase/poly-beta-1,6-N-acetylglucosamine synthase-like glycosyltransferase [Aminobacter aganoensis]
MVATDSSHAAIRPFFSAGSSVAEQTFLEANNNGLSVYELALASLPELQSALDRLGVSHRIRLATASRAAFQGTTFQTELLASGVVTEQAYFAAMAREIGVEFLTAIEPQKLMMDDEACWAQFHRRAMHARLCEAPGRHTGIVAPDQAGWCLLKQHCEGNPDLRLRIKVVAPSRLREALLERSRPMLTRFAVGNLHDNRPDCSARNVFWPWQTYSFGMLTVLLPFAMVTVPMLALFAVHLLLVSFFIACSALRAIAAIARPPVVPMPISLPLSPDLPVYSVLVALYREAEVVPDLLVGLGLLQWPRSKIEIKLVCEEDDAETIAAIRAHPLRACVEVVLVPPSLPRTKPKALSYALPLTRGELVVLYDAEDRPHPMQLAEAWRRFEASDRELACLQAPLEIANRRAGLIASMFGFEYAALFRGLLPWLAHNRIMLPLGGTSNHFRRDVLEEVGGWDPYNVTEDADLALRLARHGYRCETLSCPTREDGPEDLVSWHNQRVRWFKGWIQTWLVHMREPGALASELPFVSFVVTQILFAGMVLSSLLHLVLIAMLLGLAVQVLFDVPMSLWQSYLVAFDIISILLGYGAFLFLGWLVLKPRDRRGFWKLCLFTPVYWTMLSWAAWCALYELWRRPHHWAKTPHRKARAF